MPSSVCYASSSRRLLRVLREIPLTDPVASICLPGWHEALYRLNVRRNPSRPQGHLELLLSSQWAVASQPTVLPYAYICLFICWLGDNAETNKGAGPGFGPRQKDKTRPANNDRPSFKRDSVSENKDVNYWIDRYLGVGETVLDYSVTLAGSSGFFERKR